MAHASETALLLFRRSFTRKLRLPRATLVTILAPVAVLWLLDQIFGALPRHTTGFPTKSYLDFLAPSMLAIGALCSTLFAGMSLVDDRTSGFLEQALAAPVARASLLLARALAELVSGWLATLLMLVALLSSGVQIDAGASGVLGVLAVTSLLNLCYSGISFLIVVFLGHLEWLRIVLGTVAAASIICADTLLPGALLPGWIGTIEHLNPLAYGIHAMRSVIWHPTAHTQFVQDLTILIVLTCLSLGLALIQSRHAERYIA